MKKRPFYVVTWGGSLPEGRMICGHSKSHREAVKLANYCDAEPGSGKKHRIFLCREVSRKTAVVLLEEREAASRTK